MEKLINLLKGIGIFLTISSLFYFLFQNDIWSSTAGFASIVIMLGFNDRNEMKNIKTWFYSISAAIGIGVVSYFFVLSKLENGQIFTWIVIIGFLIATGGTIIPLVITQFIDKNKVLSVLYSIIYFGIITVTFYKKPDNYSIQITNEFDLFFSCISIMMAGLTIASLAHWIQKRNKNTKP